MTLDAVVVGAGSNGLSAAITLARAGLKVQLLEAHDRVGGGLSSIGSGGFIFDQGSAIHPLGYASPAWQEWPLHAFGLDWVHSPAPFVHLWWDGQARTLPQKLDNAVQQLGVDGPAWRACSDRWSTARRRSWKTLCGPCCVYHAIPFCWPALAWRRCPQQT
ncbi:FAD-dependent oxidoreductase [Deinococcus radiophilus]|uniref:FAD-dependent oxidoreductase n=1 Tax=Deinococcus radiophilus TaxID=32062 RepID=UPI003618BEAE